MGDSVCRRLGIHCEKLGTSGVLARARVARDAPAMRKAKSWVTTVGVPFLRNPVNSMRRKLHLFCHLSAN